MILMSKEVRINVRTTEKIKRDLEITADLRGLTVSALVNSLVVKAIREEKEREPKAFNVSYEQGGATEQKNHASMKQNHSALREIPLEIKDTGQTIRNEVKNANRNKQKAS